MKIGIDISQLAFENTGVAEYLSHLVESLIRVDKKNQYILFFSSLRKKIPASFLHAINGHRGERVVIKEYSFPPTFLDLLWNKFHMIPIEKLIGDVDVFISSDWYQPPSRRAKMVTILYDLIVYKAPEETHAKTEFDSKRITLSPNIVEIHKRRLQWVKRECDAVLCISESTKKDAIKLLGLEQEKLFVVYPGLTL